MPEQLSGLRPPVPQGCNCCSPQASRRPSLKGGGGPDPSCSGGSPPGLLPPLSPLRSPTPNGAPLQPPPPAKTAAAPPLGGGGGTEEPQRRVRDPPRALVAAGHALDLRGPRWAHAGAAACGGVAQDTGHTRGPARNGARRAQAAGSVQPAEGGQRPRGTESPGARSPRRPPKRAGRCECQDPRSCQAPGPPARVTLRQARGRHAEGGAAGVGGGRVAMAAGRA